jgi:hypothetical protein
LAALAQRLNPHDLGVERDSRDSREADIQRQERAYSIFFVALDPQAAETDVDGLQVLSEKLHAGLTAMDRCRYARVPSAIRFAASLPRLRPASIRGR